MKRITIKEIARQAGVSIGTVDRVLHKRGEVSKKTAEKVEKIAREGNYQANVVARGLKLRMNNNLAVFLPNDNEYWNAINEGIANEIGEVSGIGMSISPFLYDRKNRGSFEMKAQAMLNSKPDGVILAPILEEQARDICVKLQQSGIPYLFVDSALSGFEPLAFVGQDSVKAGYLAAKLLNYGFSEGHHAYIFKIDDFDSLNKTIDERVRGFKSFYEQHGYSSWLIEEINLTLERSEIESIMLQCQESNSDVLIFVPNSRAYEIGQLVSKYALNIRIVGFDLTDDNRAALESSSIDFIIDQNPVRQGEEAIRSFYKKNIVKEEVSDHLMPLTIYTRENLPD